MFTYQLSYTNIAGKDLAIINLARTNADTQVIECVRASNLSSARSASVAKYLNFCATNDVRVLSTSARNYPCYHESMLGASKIDEQSEEIIQLWSEIMALVQHQNVPYPAVVKTMFMGCEVVCRLDNIEITDPSREQMSLANEIFDKAMRMLPQTSPVLMPDESRNNSWDESKRARF